VGGLRGRRPAPMVRGCVRGAFDHESTATKVMRDTKFSRKKGSTKRSSQRGEQRALNEPSLEKAPERYCATSGTSIRSDCLRTVRRLKVASPRGSQDPRATGFSTGRSAGLIRRDSAVAQGKALVAVAAVAKTFTTHSMESHTRSLLTRSDDRTRRTGHAPCGRGAR
jgi:hypothetical protein